MSHPLLASASLVPILESFLSIMVTLGEILAFHQYTDLAFFFLILCVVKVWHQGPFPAIRFGLFSITTRKKRYCVAV